MKQCLGVAAVLFIATVASSQDGDSKKDLKQMEGTWKATMHEIDGKKTTEEEQKQADVKLVIKGGKYTVSFGGKVVGKGTVKLDATKKPREVDAIATEGPGKDETMKGIYELKGDEMRVCFAQPGKERPTEFRTKEGTGQMLLGYKRIKE
ncbi:MAG TPA: TIGR03067 domain-containing protein [Gemmataceae bacterium]|nr:TIGR03067 domain-containing protein [Gemmataceae bacterium]